MTYYWVYIPDENEAGCVVHAVDFEDAFKQGCAMLHPEIGVEMQIHELGESRSRIVDEIDV